MTPAQIEDAINTLVMTKYPHEVADALSMTTDDYLATVVGAALARTFADGLEQGAQREKSRLRGLLGLH